MAIAEVQKAHFNSGAGLITVTFAAPTSGNTLVVVITTEAAGSNVFATPAGWNAGRVQAEAAVFWKISNGSEVSTDFTFTGGVTCHAWGIELSGAHASAPFDTSGYNTFAIAAVAATVTDAALAVNNEYAVAMAGQNGANGGSEAADNSFTLLAVGNTRDIAASRVLVGGGGATIGTNISWLTARVGRWIIAAFKPAAPVSGGSPIPSSGFNAGGFGTAGFQA
jgi:hypothetical protein